MLLFYLRHGDPIYQPDSLTPLGKREAEALAKRLSVYGLDKIYASSSTRAMETAQPTCEILKKDMTILDWCNEGHAWQEMTVPRSDGNGKTWAFQSSECIAKFHDPEVTALGKKWYTHPDFAAFPTLRQGIERVLRESDVLLAELGYEHDEAQNCYHAVRPNDDRVALFAHQGFGMLFLSTILDIPYPMFSTHFDFSHTGMTVIEFATRSDGIVYPKALQVANDSHLYREGLPTAYHNSIRF